MIKSPNDDIRHSALTELASILLNNATSFSSEQIVDLMVCLDQQSIVVIVL